jgi:hypothetical protein
MIDQVPMVLWQQNHKSLCKNPTWAFNWKSRELNVEWGAVDDSYSCGNDSMTIQIARYLITTFLVRLYPLKYMNLERFCEKLIAKVDNMTLVVEELEWIRDVVNADVNPAFKLRPWLDAGFKMSWTFRHYVVIPLIHLPS